MKTDKIVSPTTTQIAAIQQLSKLKKENGPTKHWTEREKEIANIKLGPVFEKMSTMDPAPDPFHSWTAMMYSFIRKGHSIEDLSTKIKLYNNLIAHNEDTNEMSVERNVPQVFTIGEVLMNAFLEMSAPMLRNPAKAAHELFEFRMTAEDYANFPITHIIVDENRRISRSLGIVDAEMD